MQNTDLTTANNILQMLGGSGRLKAMIGATNFLGDNNSLTFHFKGCRKYNICRVTSNGKDLFDFELL